MTDDHQNEPHIRRRSDGSIDIDHYDRVAHRLRASDQRAALAGLRHAAGRLLRVVSFHPSARMRSFFGS